MTPTVERFDPIEAAAFFSPASAPDSPLGLDDWERQLLRPDHPFLRVGAFRALAVFHGDSLAARVVAAIDPRQSAGSVPVGTIGFVAHRGDARALRSAISAAEAWLAESGAGLIRCPVQLSTWFGHRLTLGPIGAPPQFFMEPAPTPGLVEALTDLGYVPGHRATSHLVENSRPIADGRRSLQRIVAEGFCDRPIDLGHLSDELEAIHRIASAAFPGSWGFHPLSLDEFMALYAPIARRCDPELTRIIQNPMGEAVGFTFAYEDSAPASPGGEQVYITHRRWFVLKSIAVLPEATRHGIGPALVARGGVCVGRPIANVRIDPFPTSARASQLTERCDDDRPGREVGTVHVIGANVAPPPDGSSGLPTGDIGRLDERGQLWLMGRASNVAPGPLFPAEVEPVVPAVLPWVADAALIVVHRGGATRTILAVEPAVRLPTRQDAKRARAEIVALIASRGWPISEVALLARLPRDRRSGSKVDYPRLARLLGSTRRHW